MKWRFVRSHSARTGGLRAHLGTRHGRKVCAVCRVERRLDAGCTTSFPHTATPVVPVRTSAPTRWNLSTLTFRDLDVQQSPPSPSSATTRPARFSPNDVLG